MERLSGETLLTYVGGRASGAVPSVACVSTDSRKIGRECLFIPLKGERMDGHDFIRMAAENGAVCALSHRTDIGDVGIPVIYVEDTGKALCDLAGAYLRALAIPVIGVTGSVGKTTTREMIAAVMEQKYKTLQPEGNFNNEIGLPLTILRLDRSYELAVLELGMSHAGEIERLSKIAQPAAAVITNIGVSHIENLGSKEAILNAKLEILKGMKPGSPVALCGDDPLLRRVAPFIPFQTVLYGIENDGNVRAEDIQETPLETRFTVCTKYMSFPVTLNVPGRHNIKNALAAAVCGIQFGLTTDEIALGLTRYRAGGMRQHRYERGGFSIIEDCYNASPDSMRAAFDVMKCTPCAGRRIAVLGGMCELGAYAARLHEEVGAAAAGAAAALYLFGEGAEGYRHGACAAGMEEADIHLFDTHTALAEQLADDARAGDLLLFKGSRAMRMEEALALFLQKTGV